MGPNLAPLNRCGVNVAIHEKNYGNMGQLSCRFNDHKVSVLFNSCNEMICLPLHEAKVSNEIINLLFTELLA
jgi:hypothetical protein